MSLILFDRNALPEPETGAPAAERVVSGDPRFLTWNLDTSEDEKTYAGFWQATAGRDKTTRCGQMCVCVVG